MLMAYKYRMYPNKEQQKYFAKTFGCVRFIYNRMLSDKIKYYNETKQKYEYHCIDPKTNVEYECIRVPNEVKCGFNTAVNFYFMTGGLAGDKTWFNAQKAELPKSK